MKTVEQQALQAIHRSRQLLIQESTALSNHLRGLLMEFGVVIPQGFASLLRAVPAFKALLDEYQENAKEQRQIVQAMTDEAKL